MLKELDRGLEELRLYSTTADHKLKGRGLGDEDTCDLQALSWYQWGQALDLQPAAELADFFSRENEDMFGNQQNGDHLGRTRTSASPNLDWETSTSLNSTRQASPYGITPSAVNMQGFPKYLHQTAGPPSSTYNCPAAPGFEQKTPTSYLGLLTSNEEPLSQLGDVLANDGLVSSAKRTKYMYEDRQAMPTTVSSSPNSDSSQLPPLPSSFYTSDQTSTIYRSSLPVSNTASRSPLSNASYSPAHRLSPEYNPYHSPSSGYYDDASSPGTVFSPCPSSALPDSPRSVNSTSPSDSSSGSLSPNNSPVDSGLSSALWSPNSQSHSVTSSYPFSPGAADVYGTGSLIQSALPQPEMPASTSYTSQGSAPTTTPYGGHSSSVTPTSYTGYNSPATSSQYSGQGSATIQPSGGRVSSQPPTASGPTALTKYPPVTDFSEYDKLHHDVFVHLKMCL